MAIPYGEAQKLVNKEFMERVHGKWVDNPKRRWYKPWIAKQIKLPNPLTEFMINAFSDYMPKPKDGFLTMFRNHWIKNTDRRWYNPWIKKRIPKPTDPNAETVAFDIVKGSHG